MNGGDVIFDRLQDLRERWIEPNSDLDNDDVELFRFGVNTARFIWSADDGAVRLADQDGNLLSFQAGYIYGNYFAGNGGGLSNLDGSAIASGQIANARLSTTAQAAIGGTFSGNVAVAGTLATQNIVTAGTSVKIGQTGDLYGATYLTMQSRNGAAGAIFSNPSLDLVDLGFIPSSNVQSNIRLEHRSGFTAAANSTGEFQFYFDATGSTPIVGFYTGKATAGFAGSLTTTGPIRPGTYTVATLPTPGTSGRIAMATNARNTGEGAGAGTGSIVADNGSSWRIPGQSTAVAA